MNIKTKIKHVISYIKKKEKIPIYISKETTELFKGKTVLISGGSGGIGRAIANKMKLCGANVIISGVNEKKLKKISEEIGNITYVILDIRSINSITNVINSINGQIDILINCAGINNGDSFFDVKEETFDNIYNINVKGTYFLSQIIAKRMIENNIKGHILNVSSASALRPASTPYAISKWAIDGMTKGLADILIPYGITVNAIGPGPTATEMLNMSQNDEISHEKSPIGRYATPEEIANLAVFMVSNMGDLIVGDTFYISGGSGVISLHR